MDSKAPRGCVEVFEALEKAYGKPEPRELPDDPLDTLVMTILSQNTTDKNSLRAYADLRARFPAWSDVADADASDIEDAIRTGGLAATKSHRIKEILESLRGEEGGEPSLKHLASMTDEQVMEELTAMKGVGPKTAACVALFGLGRPVFPVDTHIHRVSQRLGLVKSGLSREKTQEELDRAVPSSWKYAGHLLLIEHGRRTCKAQNPLCTSCPLGDRCCSVTKRKPTKC
eukprot:m51a1_g9601 putative -gpd family protein (229) ;mRNA; r:1049655-1050571